MDHWLSFNVDSPVFGPSGALPDSMGDLHYLTSVNIANTSMRGTDWRLPSWAQLDTAAEAPLFKPDSTT